jgi:hypothetical protein
LVEQLDILKDTKQVGNSVGLSVVLSDDVKVANWVVWKVVVSVEQTAEKMAEKKVVHLASWKVMIRVEM